MSTLNKILGKHDCGIGFQPVSSGIGFQPVSSAVTDASIDNQLAQDCQPESPLQNQPVDNHCPQCGSPQLWQPLGSRDWYCLTCQPPPSQSMIGQLAGAPRIIDEIAYAVGHPGKRTALVMGNLIEYDTFITRPICDCGSHHVTETRWSDGLVVYECSSCAANISFDPQHSS